MKKIVIKGVEVLMNELVERPTKLLILLHGRGATAEGIFSIKDDLNLPESCLVLAPQAPGRSWYPNRFIVPKSHNEPYLSASLSVIEDLLEMVFEEYGILKEQVVLFGFSQGACLASEFVKVNPTKYAGVIVSSGGLIGGDRDVIADVEGDLLGTPIYLGCDSEDFHIPIERVELTSQVFEQLNAKLTKRVYTDFGHSIHSDAIDFLNGLF